MTRLLRTILTVTIGLCLVSCGSASGARDTSRPEFIEMTVTVQRVSDGFEEPPVDAISGLTLNDVERDRRIILQATVADDESGLEPVTVDGETHWDCTTPGEAFGEHLHGTVGNPMDEELSSGTTPTGSPTVRNVTFSLDPFADDDQRLVCPPTDLASELLMEVVLVAENGDRLEARSAELSVVYQPRQAG